MASPERGKLDWPRLAARLSVELGPPLLFFAVLRLSDIFIATAVFLVAILLATAVSWRRERRIPVVPTATALLALIFGGATLLFEAPLYIKLRPTVTNLLGAAVLAGGLARGRFLLREAFGAGIKMPEAAWRQVSWQVIAFLLVMALLNEVVWRLASTDTWAAFKAFVVPLLNFLFIAASLRFVRRQLER